MATTTMEAAVFHGQERITICSAPVPEVGPGEVLVRVRRTALCSSDVKLWHRGAQHTAGHEIAGVVEQPGHPLDGRRCAVYIPVHCGACDSCRRGDTQMCLAGSSLIGWNRPGGYAEYLPVPENCLLPLPDDVADDLAPLLLDTIGTSAHAARFASKVVPPHDCGAVLVTGAGPVGLGALVALQSLGYKDIHVADPNAARGEIAHAFGARRHPVGDTSRRFALIIECSGAHAARNFGIAAILPRGALVLVGENAAPWTIEEGPVFRRKDFYMIRTFYFPIGDFADNVALLRARRDDFRRLVDAKFALAALPGHFAKFAAGKLVKPLLAFD